MYIYVHQISFAIFIKGAHKSQHFT